MHHVKYHLPQLFYRDKHGVIIVSWNKSNLQKELRRKYLCHQTIIIQKDFDESDLAEELFNEIKEKHQLYIQFFVNNDETDVRDQIWEKDFETIHLNVISLVQLIKLILLEIIQRIDERIAFLELSTAYLLKKIEGVIISLS